MGVQLLTLKKSTVYIFLTCLIFFCSKVVYGAPPSNDNCIAAEPIIIPNSGFSLGTFTGANTDMTAATLETGESFASAIFVAGLDKKSVWYRFSLPTTRGVKVTLTQPGVQIAAGDAGFTIYKTSNCLPGAADIYSKFTPNPLFGDSYHPCVEPGDYLVQVSSKAGASGQLFIKIELTEPSPAPYDKQVDAYRFGSLDANNFTRFVDYPVDCQSIENTTEVCSSLNNYQQYTKSTWHTFTTPAYFDLLSVLLSGTGSTSYFTGYHQYETFGYNLYAGDASSVPFSSLTLVDGCDSFVTDGYLVDYKMYKCNDLQPNTTYSIQLFFRQNFINNVKLAVAYTGTKPTQAPEPITALVPASNKLGVLASGATTTATDQFACNSRHSLHPCNQALPDTGVFNSYDGFKYNLSTFFTFTLPSTSKLSISISDFSTPPYYYYSPNLAIRVFAQDITTNCGSLDTSKLLYPLAYAGSGTGWSLDCVPPGNYTIQVLGKDSTVSFLSYLYYGYLNSSYILNLKSDLGKKFNLNITVAGRNGSNKFDLATAGAFDSINVVGGSMQPLVDGVVYTSKSDTFGCANTVLPIDTVCAPTNTKASYRQFILADSGMLAISGSTYWNKLYHGDVNALANAQNAHGYPERITGLAPQTNCIWYNECTGTRTCVIPGDYSYVSYANETNIGYTTQPSFQLIKFNTTHDSPANAEDMGILNPGVNTLASTPDYFSCKDNAIPINGYLPCVYYSDTCTKAMYRQFYLSAAATISVQVNVNYCNYPYSLPTNTIFAGKATDGITGLVPLAAPFQCFGYASTNYTCNVLNPGWYTVVSYGTGPSYTNPFQSLDKLGYSSFVGLPVTVTVSGQLACPGPQYNRPYKAQIDTNTNQPFLVEWAPGSSNTSAYPQTFQQGPFYKEHFNCSVDTPFSSHPIPNCDPSLTKVAYFVFRTTQLAYVKIDTKGYWGAVYSGNARTDSASFGPATLIQPCISNNSHIQLCNLPAGVYTLVVFGNNTQNCVEIEPTIYTDKVGYSRFDFAKNAYDFGVVPPDSIYHGGKVGDVNPIDPGRLPSSDIIYCTTGASQSDPDDIGCTLYKPDIYNLAQYYLWTQTNSSYYDVAKRNLWYTFVVKEGGNVRIQVLNKTAGKNYFCRYAVYKSDVNGTIPFTTVVSSGQIDSTVAQGLTLVTKNYTNYYCVGATTDANFYRDPCSAITERYYIVVESPNNYPYDYGGEYPNYQVEVKILVDSINAILPKFDHYYQANNLGVVNSGIKKGTEDNYSCATRDATDPLAYYTSCNKTLWYKFTTTVTGNIRYWRFKKDNGIYHGLGGDYYIQLFQQIIPGDSTTTGLLHLPNTTAYYDGNGDQFGYRCITPGTYYILLTGCDALNEYTYPQIEILPTAGDFCSTPVIAQVNGAGAVSATLYPDCHTIGTDYGEFGPTLTCPSGATTTDYKTSWFRMDIGGADTLDVTAYLIENTNASSTQIKYRLMTGDCGAMQEQSCVQDALTQNTYQCLLPGQQYYVQVFTPVTVNGVQVTGSLELKLSAAKHADTCAPPNTCLVSANFISSFDCTTDRGVKFSNYSTYGTTINYKWDLGYGGQTSTALSPTFVYPATTAAQIYNVKLVTTNTGCGKSDSVTIPVTIPGRPLVSLGNDQVRCNGTTATLDATSFAGATYRWQDGSTNPTFVASAAGQNTYYVEVTYNSCISRDTINILLNPVIKLPIQNLILCSGDSALLNVSQGYGETYTWNTGVTTASVYAYAPGTYWVDIKYNTCTIRDTFIVSNVTNAQPLGNDRTICFALGNYSADATVSGAISYSWQNGSTNPVFSISEPGIYWVNINFGACTVRDSITITGFPAAIVSNTTAATCAGIPYTLPWGPSVTTAGIYRDTIRYASGCDSFIRSVTVTVNPKPSLGPDKPVAICSDNSVNLQAQYNTSGLATSWTLNGTTVSNPTLVISTGVYQLIAINTSNCADTALVTLTVNSKPAIGLDKATSVCTGVVTDLTTQFITTGLTTSWTRNGTVVSNPAAVTTGGVYQLIVTNAAGCTDTATYTLTLYQKPNLGIDKSISICAGTVADLSTQLITTGLTNSWTLGGAIVNNPTAVSTAGTYQLIAANTDGCSDTANVIITVNPVPALGADKSAAICYGDRFDLTSQFSTAGLTTNWTLNGIAVGSPATVTTAGIYQLIVTNSDGCKDTALFTLTINPKPMIGADKNISSCPGITTDLTSQFITTGLTVNWTLGGISVSNPASVNAAGIYQLIAVNSNGCSDTALVTVSANSKPDLGPDKSITACDGVTIDLSTQFTTSGLSPAWTLNGNSVLNPAAVATAGIYQLIAGNTSGCSDTALLTVTINPKPTIGADKATSICQDNLADLTNLFNTTGLTESWTSGGIPVADPKNISSTGIYQLIVTNTDGCTDTALVNVTVNAKPNLGTDKMANICEGAVVDLTSQFTTTDLATAWTINGNAQFNPAVVTDAGTYRLIALNTQGCSDTALITVTISTKPSIGADRSISICAGKTFDLTAEYITTGLTESWTINGVAVADPSIASLQGAYRLIVLNTKGCSDTAIINLTVNPSPALGADKTLAFCTGGSISLTGLFNTTGLAENWTSNGISVANPAVIKSSGDYQLVVVNNFNCSDTAMVNISIYPLPVLTVTDPVPVCFPSKADITSTNITAGSSSNLVFSYWQDAAAIVPYTSAAEALSGTYYIKGTDLNGCVTTEPVKVIIYPQPIVNAGRDTAICTQAKALLHATAMAPEAGAISYLWSPNAGLTNAMFAISEANPSATTLYTITATADYGICSVPATDDILVTVQPPVVAFAGNDTIAVLGLSHQLSGSGGISYLWSPSSLVDNPFAQNPMATLQQDTRFTLEVKDIAGCTGYDTVNIKVYEGITYYIPNAFSPNGDGHNETFKPLAVGITTTYWFRIFNRYGELIYETSDITKGWDGTYKGKLQSIGNYIWYIKGKARTGKIIEMKGNVVLLR